MPWSASVGELSDRLQSREVSAVELAEAFVGRIADVDGQVGAFLSTTDPERLMREAALVAQARQRDEHPSPLAGIPIAVKDNIAVEDESLTCGSRLLADYTPPYTSTAVERLRQAGLLGVRKNNKDEVGFGSSTENSAFQVTRNPRGLDRVPGGTSGGPAGRGRARGGPWSVRSAIRGHRS